MKRRLFFSLLIALALSRATAVAAQEPELMVQSPSSGQAIKGTDVPVVFHSMSFNIVPSSVPLSEAGKHPELNRAGEGHVHLMLDLQPLVVWYKSDPYSFTNLPPGEHQLMVELVNNDHSSLSPPVVQIVRFHVELAIPTTGMAGPLSAEEARVLALIGAVLIAAGAVIRLHQRKPSL